MSALASQLHSRLNTGRWGTAAVVALSSVLLAMLSTLVPVAHATVAHPHRARSARHTLHHKTRHHKAHHHRTRHTRVVHHALASVPRGQQASAPTSAPLSFGIYPGGAAGTVGPSGPIKPEDPAKRLAALEALRAPGRPFVLHLYAGYTGLAGWSVADQLGKQISQYTAAGFQVEPVLTYRPADGGSQSDVAGFVSFTRAAVRAFGANPGFVSLQVTNEANLGGAPNASDGYYAGAKDALIQGVIAAKAETRADGFNQVKVGFNWAYATDSAETSFWKYLAKGGRAFTNSLDWVGLDAYPGTWGPAIGGDLAGGTVAALDNAMASLRQRYMPLAGIPASVALHVSESGYPTGPGRTQAAQVTAMRSAIGAVNAARTTYNVTDYRWFDLRDNDSASTSFEDQYGLMSDDYTPKAAFATFHDLVAALS
jgi:hypothetical protein